MPKKVTDKMFIKFLRGELLDEGGNFTISILNSNPPVGKCKVTNIYVDQNTGKLVISYDDQPVD